MPVIRPGLPRTIRTKPRVQAACSTNPRANQLYAKQHIYDKGKVYQVYMLDGYAYIGSTCRELKERIREHRTDHKSSVFQHIKRNKQPKSNVEIRIAAKLTLLQPERTREVQSRLDRSQKLIKIGPKLINKRSNPIIKRKAKTYGCTLSRKWTTWKSALVT